MITVDALLDQLSSTIETLSVSPRLREAIRYACLDGGKRTRPGVVAGLGSDLFGEIPRLGPVAVAVELIHCSSLIHDDLPALDNDDMRRGRPSLHRAFDEATALLTGDSLISVASLVVSRAEAIDVAHKVSLLEELHSAFLSLCDGQLLDVDSSAQRLPADEIHRQKTGALFGATCAMTAVVCGVSDEGVRRCREMGVELGVLFQYVDDYLDRFGDSSITGREVASDAKNHRVTAFSHVERQSARDAFAAVYRRVIDRIVTVEDATGSPLHQTRVRVGEILQRSNLATE